MKRIGVLLLFCLLFVFYAETQEVTPRIADEDPDSISNYARELINNGILKPLSMLETANVEIFNSVISFIPKNELIENYYYQVHVHIKINKNTEKDFTAEEYNKLKNLPEYKDYEFKYIIYSIYHREILLNKYNFWLGDPTGKCFTLSFNENNEFLGRILWK